MEDNKENSPVFSCTGHEGHEGFVQNMSSKEAFVMALRKATNHEGLANWTDVRHQYKKYTGGRQLNHEELEAIAGTHNKTKRELFQDDLAHLLTPYDAQGNVVRVHSSNSKNPSPISFDSNLPLPPTTNIPETHTSQIGPSGDFQKFKENEDFDTRVSGNMGEPSKTTLLLRKEKHPDVIAKSGKENSQDLYQPDIGRSLPAVLVTPRLEEKIRIELEECRLEKEMQAIEPKKKRRLSQEIEKEVFEDPGLLMETRPNASEAKSTQQPNVERIPTWEKNFVNSVSGASAESHNSRMIRDIESFLAECSPKNGAPDERVDGVWMLSRATELTKLDLQSVGILNPPVLNDDGNNKKKKQGFHLMRQRHSSLSCCGIL